LHVRRVRSVSSGGRGLRLARAKPTADARQRHINTESPFFADPAACWPAGPVRRVLKPCQTHVPAFPRSTTPMAREPGTDDRQLPSKDGPGESTRSPIHDLGRYRRALRGTALLWSPRPWTQPTRACRCRCASASRNAGEMIARPRLTFATAGVGRPTPRQPTEGVNASLTRCFI